MTEEEKRQLSEEKERLDEEFGRKREVQQQNCAYLGQRYYQLVDGNPELAIRDEEMENYIKRIRDMEAEIQIVQERLSEVGKELAAPAAVRCPGCGRKMEGSAKFCSECGRDLRGMGSYTPEMAEKEQICQVCKSALKPGAKFCGKCGAPVA